MSAGEATETGAAEPSEWTVDGLARRADLPVRTIREYQTIGLLPSPRRRGRIALYGAAHLARIQLIGRLQQRGYSLRGIHDLLESWRDGADLSDVLGLSADQLVHIDEPGVSVSLAELEGVLPGLVPERLNDLLAASLIDECSPGRYCAPSPSLIQLAADALAAGVPPARVVALVKTMSDAAAAIADAVDETLGAVPTGSDPAQVQKLVTRGRGLLGHAAGRLTIYMLGRKLAASGDLRWTQTGARQDRRDDDTGQR